LIRFGFYLKGSCPEEDLRGENMFFRLDKGLTPLPSSKFLKQLNFLNVKYPIRNKKSESYLSELFLFVLSNSSFLIDYSLFSLKTLRAGINMKTEHHQISPPCPPERGNCRKSLLN
jgi:hypothetical protein